MALETELKVLDVDLDAVRRSLHHAGGELQGRVFEANEVFDDAAGSLRSGGVLLRLRRDPGGLLTLKLPASGPAGLKVREERETRVADPDAARAILEGLGYRVLLRYEKVRETWLLAGCHVCLDHLPFGDFVEFEGPPEAIAEAVARLGLEGRPTSDRNYHALYREHLARRGLPARDSFVFEDAERKRLLSDLANPT
ncbi:MAG: class IV adenylate cyclase [Thermodesulfobacteriota bacterium]